MWEFKPFSSGGLNAP